MATIPASAPSASDEQRFFLISAIVMAALIAAGFSFQLAMGRSSFGAPPRVHIHALLFFGWTMLYLVQNCLIATGSVALHRRLGWLALGWIPAMVGMGCYVTVEMVRAGHAPFFFQPGYFLVMNPVSVLTFAGLAFAAIARRRDTQWHRRLMFCAMTILLGPAVGRLAPLPLMIPYAGWGVFAMILLFPIAGIVRDLRRSGRVHQAWLWGVATIAGAQILMDVIAFSRLGLMLYQAVTAGTPGAQIAPLAFPPFPAA